MRPIALARETDRGRIIKVVAGRRESYCSSPTLPGLIRNVRRVGYLLDEAALDGVVAEDQRAHLDLLHVLHLQGSLQGGVDLVRSIRVVGHHHGTVRVVVLLAIHTVGIASSVRGSIGFEVGPLV
jgi:hypothetical protein